jgi:hypothetical protein
MVMRTIDQALQEMSADSPLASELREEGERISQQHPDIDVPKSLTPPTPPDYPPHPA